MSVNKEMYLEFKNYGIDIPNVPKDRNYWLIRTAGGEWYDEFTNDGFIGINWNELSIDHCESVNRTAAEIIISNYYPESKQPGKIINNIYKFYKQIKSGDLVMIPDQNSKKINFGIVEEDSPYELTVSQTKIDEGYCPFIKRRKITWVKEVYRSHFSLKLFRMMQSHNTISNANDYADEIDSILNDFYLKGDTVHYKIKVNKENDLTYQSLRTLVNIPWDLANYINSDYNLNDLITTISVQSPGDQKLVGKGKKSVTFFVGLSILLTFPVTAIVGGKVVLKDFSFETNGLLNSLFKNNDSENKELLRKLEEIEKLKKENDIRTPIPKKVIEEVVETEEIKETTDENNKTTEIHKTKKTSKRTEKQVDEN